MDILISPISWVAHHPFFLHNKESSISLYYYIYITISDSSEAKEG